MIDFVSPSCHSLVEGGRVYIRDWREKMPFRADVKRKPVTPGALKTRLCWFHAHHPQGCPLQAESCAFAHGAHDLRPSTRPLKKIKNEAFWSTRSSRLFIDFVWIFNLCRALHIVVWTLVSSPVASKIRFRSKQRVLLRQRYIISGNWSLEISQSSFVFVRLPTCISSWWGFTAGAL